MEKINVKGGGRRNKPHGKINADTVGKPGRQHRHGLMWQHTVAKNWPLDTVQIKAMLWFCQRQHRPHTANIIKMV